MSSISSEGCPDLLSHVSEHEHHEENLRRKKGVFHTSHDLTLTIVRREVRDRVKPRGLQL